MDGVVPLDRRDLELQQCLCRNGHRQEGNIVSPGDLRDAARRLDDRHRHTFGHTEAKSAGASTTTSPQVVDRIGAGDGDRTRDIELGKLAFYR
jgi:hypothetical protein